MQGHTMKHYYRASCQTPLPIAEATEGEDKAYMDCLNIAGDGIMGIVEIPKIDIKLPIYHTTREDVLQVAAGHLEGSSLPIGGEKYTRRYLRTPWTSECVSFLPIWISWKKAITFLIHVLNETLSYEVDKISVVKTGRNFLSCSRRRKRSCNTSYLYSIRSQIPSGFWSVVTEYLMWNRKLPMRIHRSAESVFIQIIVLWVIVGLAVTAIFILVLYLKEKKLQKKKNETS